MQFQCACAQCSALNRTQPIHRAGISHTSMATETPADVEMKDVEKEKEKEGSKQEVDPNQAQKEKDLLTFEGSIKQILLCCTCFIFYNC